MAADYKWSYHEAVQSLADKSDEERRWVELLDLITARLYPYQVDGYIKPRLSNLYIVVTRKVDDREDVSSYPIALEAIELADVIVLVDAISQIIRKMFQKIDVDRVMMDDRDRVEGDSE